MHAPLPTFHRQAGRSKLVRFMKSAQTSAPYPEVESQPSFPAIEQRVRERWEAEETFRRSVEERPTGERGANEYVFYDGPPFANGLPHYGHLLTGYAKDVVPRYQTMRGRRVERRFGWDTHGLPAEMQAEKELGISGRQAILEYGVDKFNAACRASVGNVTEEWEAYVARQGRWVDLANDYKTLDFSYMESVMWALKQLWDKGLLYEGYRVMPYSWAAETPLSNFEVRLDDSYRERQDPAVTVAVELDLGGEAVRALVWTTTPWTLPSNLAVAVGPEIDYQLFEWRGATYLMGAAVFAANAERYEGAVPGRTLPGAELVGASYTPIFDYFAGHEGAFRVLAGDFVNTDEGTGIVHMAPGFGEDDQAVCEANGIAVVCPVDEAGRFTSEVPDWQGLNVLEANKPIIAELKQRGVLVWHDTIVHNYPHCWRTDQPLIYRALSSWYVKVTDFRERMVELNQSIRWIPERIRDGQFGKWLEGARDWSISRNRFWGMPLPIWQSDDPAYPRVDVYGSVDELERDFGVRPDDLHRPFIDELVRPNPDDPTGKSMMRRVPDVLDCWFESGSMPFAQVHYPFENKEWFEDHFPADFICEYVGQTRGWFYTLMVLGTALFDKPPFENCICHGVVLDNQGRKLSKRLRNYADPVFVFDTYGSDAMRWYLMSSPVLRGGDLRVSEDGAEFGEVVRLVLNPIWNAYSFFSLYANADGLRGSFRPGAEGRLDRYVLAKTRHLIEAVGGAMDDYDLSGACAEVRSFLDALNNWYIRRSRQRFWRREQDADKQAAYDTLYTVLVTLCKVAAPLLPFITDEVYRGLTAEGSVHLTDWPDASEFPDEPELVRDMDRVRDVCSTALALRKEHNLRVRLPLAELTVAGAESGRLEPFADLVREEVNVKRVSTSDDLEALARFDLKVNARAVGPRVGKEMKAILAAARAGEWTSSEGGVITVAGHEIAADEYELRLLPREDGDSSATGALSTNDAVVALDVEIDADLEREGLARDVVRQVQIARREAGLDVSDRVSLFLSGGDAVVAAVEAHSDYVREQVLAEHLSFEPAPEGTPLREAELEGAQLLIALVKS